MKDVGGRPLLFKSVEELQHKIDCYFIECDNYTDYKGRKIAKPYTVSGLASYLGTSRQTLVNYENKDEEFFDTIKTAKEKIEANMEERALMGEINPTIAIFSLKNNYNWKDKTEVDSNVKGEMINKITIEGI